MIKLDPISRYLVQSSRRIGPVILMYHSIDSSLGTPDWLWSVSLKRFVDQVDLLLDAGWEFRKVSELFSNHSAEERAIAITFDDGYLDNFPAYEALAARGLTATWYIVSANVGQPAAWSDETTRGWPMLDRVRLQEMAEAGMEIGCHSRHHCRLAEIPSKDLPDEIIGGRHELEQIIQRPVKSFAYPHGSYNDQVVATVRDAGYTTACTTRAGQALVDEDILRMRRLAVYSCDTLSSFSRKIGLMRNEATWRRVAEHFIGI